MRSEAIEKVVEILGEPSFKGEVIGIWKTDQDEFSLSPKLDGSFAVFIYDANEGREITYDCAGIADVTQRAKEYKRGQRNIKTQLVVLGLKNPLKNA